MEQKQESTKGIPMFVESLLSPGEWEKCKKFYGTYNGMSHAEAHEEKPNPFKWRFKMGESLKPEQIALINGRLDAIKKKSL